MAFCQILDGEVNTEAKLSVEVKRNILLGEFAERMIHTHKEIETLGGNVKHPAERGAESTDTIVDADTQPVNGSDICTEAEVGPCIPACHVGSIQKSKSQAAILRESIARAGVHRSCNGAASRAGVAVIIKLIKRRERVGQRIHRVVKIIGVERIVVGRHDTVTVGRSLPVFLPVDETDVIESESEVPVLIKTCLL